MFILRISPLTSLLSPLYKVSIDCCKIVALYNSAARVINLTMCRFMSLLMLTYNPKSLYLTKIRLFSSLSKSVPFRTMQHLFFEWRGKHHTDDRYSVVTIRGGICAILNTVTVFVEWSNIVTQAIRIPNSLSKEAIYHVDS